MHHDRGAHQRDTRVVAVVNADVSQLFVIDFGIGHRKPTAAEIRRAGMVGAAAVISFDQRAIVRMRSIAPEITRGRVYGHTSADEVLATAAEAGCEIVMPHKSQIQEPLVTRAREAGLKLATWVVDEPEELRALARFGLYGVGSNRPGVLLEALADGLLG